MKKRKLEKSQRDNKYKRQKNDFLCALVVKYNKQISGRMQRGTLLWLLKHDKKKFDERIDQMDEKELDSALRLLNEVRMEKYYHKQYMKSIVSVIRKNSAETFNSSVSIDALSIEDMIKIMRESIDNNLDDPINEKFSIKDFLCYKSAIIIQKNFRGYKVRKINPEKCCLELIIKFVRENPDDPLTEKIIQECKERIRSRKAIIIQKIKC